MFFTFTSFKKTFHLFLPYLIKYPDSQKRCLIAIGLVVVDIAIASLIPYCSKWIVDSATAGIFKSLGIGVLFLGIFWISDKIINHLQEIIFFPALNRVTRDMTQAIVAHIHKISLIDYQLLSMSEMISCIKRISLSARLFIKIFLLMIIPTIIKLIIATFITIKLDLFGFVLIPGFLLSFIILFRGIKRYIKARDAAWNTTDHVITRVYDSILNTKIIRPFHTQGMQTLGLFLDKEAELWKEENFRLHWMYVTLGLTLGGILTLVLYGALERVQSGELSIGDFVMIKGQLIAAFLPLKTFAQEFRQLMASIIDIKKNNCHF